MSLVVVMRFKCLAAATTFVLLPLLASCSGTSSKIASKETSAPFLASAMAMSSDTEFSDIPIRAYYGDTHLHTAFSSDAGLVGATVGPSDAYRFSRGEVVKSNTGIMAQLKRPLDFAVVADHAENLGLKQAIDSSDPDLQSDPFGKQLWDLFQQGKGYEAYLLMLNNLGKGGDNAQVKSKEMQKTYWNKIVDSAEQFNSPGKFTAFIGYEWTSQPGGNNIHRVVILEDGAKEARQILPFSAFDSDDVEDLWVWMAKYEQSTGGRVLAIPHNGNLSNGLMFRQQRQRGGSFDADYVKLRRRFEPLYEVTQMKGTGEAHPLLSPNDEFAAFEIFDKGNLSGSQAKTSEMLPTEYVRPALLAGLQLERSLGINPFKFGLIGSTDSHTGLATTSEDNWFGKATVVEPSPKRWEDILIKSLKDPSLNMTALDLAASGLAGVWATENTRESLFAAMKRKEVFGTSGTRLQVRVFGGYNFAEEDLVRNDFAKYAYQNGVPMGGDLRIAKTNQVPSFLIQARKDPDGANLDRVQIVKGWLDKDGQTKEQIYEVVWGDSDRRKLDPSGKLPAVGSSVNLREASYSNTIGAPILNGYWKDPNFNPSERAFYYVRVLEIPTPRWVAYDRKKFNLTLPDGINMTSQERAYSSPIWYNPS
jgi:hypothetical protein